MIEWTKALLDFLKSQGYSTYTIVVIMLMSTFIFLLLTLLKKPIKKLTKRIKNTKIRHLANKTIILLAYGISILGWYILSKVAPGYFSFDLVEVVLTGSVPIVAYAVGDGVLTKSEASSNVQKILEITKDGQVTPEELCDTVDELDKALDVDPEADEEDYDYNQEDWAEDDKFDGEEYDEDEEDDSDDEVDPLADDIPEEPENENKTESATDELDDLLKNL